MDSRLGVVLAGTHVVIRKVIAAYRDGIQFFARFGGVGRECHPFNAFRASHGWGAVQVLECSGSDLRRILDIAGMRNYGSEGFHSWQSNKDCALLRVARIGPFFFGPKTMSMIPARIDIF